ncbi:uncharacterized protein AtWU_07441 [Aspergillus tubingensis]|uniref:uncharacterized protein n=1 Tax=Aspergillus tubingensis TaxID=5068 RepID=UPI0015791A56|nr:uncharacterized protein AtWU_07441 [Aspergillus tubingensis]GFN17639.1 hypothetical protein AtWU_07441 [Aspergillus tubingensis]
MIAPEREGRKPVFTGISCLQLINPARRESVKIMTDTLSLFDASRPRIFDKSLDCPATKSWLDEIVYAFRVIVKQFAFAYSLLQSKITVDAAAPSRYHCGDGIYERSLFCILSCAVWKNSKILLNVDRLNMATDKPGFLLQPPTFPNLDTMAIVQDLLHQL